MTAAVSLILVLTVSIFITRVATVALVHTGLSAETARFQARSAFTGVGFTTEESEKVVNHPLRRRILLLLMLLGNAGIVTAVSSFILAFTGAERGAATWVTVAVIVGGVVAVCLLAWSSWVDRHMSRLIRWALSRYTRVDVRDYATLLHVHGEYSVTELFVGEGDWLAGRSLRESDLSGEGVLVLGIQRKGGRYVGTPGPDARMRAGDTLILYGRVPVLEAIDERRAGSQGDREHSAAVGDQERVARDEESQETAGA